MFSVIIPTKNRSDMLRRAVTSVLQQTDQDFEIIVVDDGSDPAEAKAIDQIVDGAKNARLVRFKISRGAPAARNAAIAEAKGTLIATLDSDDWWTNDRLEKHRNLLADETVVLSYNRASLMRSASLQPVTIYGHAPLRGLSTLASLAGWNHFGGCSSVCFRKDAFKRVGGFEIGLPSGQDWDLWLKLIGQGKVAYSSEPLTLQDIGDHERITTAQQKVLAGHKIIVAKTSAIDFSAVERRSVLAHQSWVEAEIGARFGDPALTRSALMRSLRIKPTMQLARNLPHLVRSALGR